MYYKHFLSIFSFFFPLIQMMITSFPFILQMNALTNEVGRYRQSQKNVENYFAFRKRAAPLCRHRHFKEILMRMQLCVYICSQFILGVVVCWCQLHAVKKEDERFVLPFIQVTVTYSFFKIFCAFWSRIFESIQSTEYSF